MVVNSYPSHFVPFFGHFVPILVISYPAKLDGLKNGRTNMFQCIYKSADNPQQLNVLRSTAVFFFFFFFFFFFVFKQCFEDGCVGRYYLSTVPILDG